MEKNLSQLQLLTGNACIRYWTCLIYIRELRTVEKCGWVTSLHMMTSSNGNIFVRGIHRSPVNSPHKNPNDVELWCSQNCVVVADGMALIAHNRCQHSKQKITSLTTLLLLMAPWVVIMTNFGATIAAKVVRLIIFCCQGKNYCTSQLLQTPDVDGPEPG